MWRSQTNHRRASIRAMAVRWGSKSRIIAAMILASASFMLTLQPALAVTSDEAGQMDIWDSPTSSNTTGPQPVACSFTTGQPLVPQIDTAFTCSQPERYGRDRSGQTYCNAYATVVMDLIFPEEMAQLRAGLGENHPSVLADNFYNFFSTHWAVVSPTLTTDQRIAQAQYFADAGYLVVASEPGHIGFVESSAVPYAQTTTDSLLLAQGGATAGRDIPLSRAWRAAAIHSQVMFFYKQPGAALVPVMTLAQIIASQPKPVADVDTDADSNNQATPGPVSAGTTPGSNVNEATVPIAVKHSEGDL